MTPTARQSRSIRTEQIGSESWTYLKRNDGCAGFSAQRRYAAFALACTAAGAASRRERNAAVVWDCTLQRLGLAGVELGERFVSEAGQLVLRPCEGGRPALFRLQFLQNDRCLLERPAATAAASRLSPALSPIAWSWSSLRAGLQRDPALRHRRRPGAGADGVPAPQGSADSAQERLPRATDTGPRRHGCLRAAGAATGCDL